MKQDFVRRTRIPGLDLGRAWKLIHDAEAIAGCSSHIDGAEEVGEREWTARLFSTVGPFTVRAPIQVSIIEEQPPLMVRVRIRGEERTVGTRLAVDMVGRLQPDTEMADALLEGSYEVTGTVANLGGALVRREAEAMIHEFWDRFCAMLSTQAQRRDVGRAD